MEVHVAVLMRREHEDGTNDVGGDRDTDQVSQDVKSIAYHGKDDEKSGGRASVTVEYHDGNVGPKPYYFDNIFTEDTTREHMYDSLLGQACDDISNGSTITTAIYGGGSNFQSHFVLGASGDEVGGDLQHAEYYKV